MSLRVSSHVLSFGSFNFIAWQAFVSKCCVGKESCAVSVNDGIAKCTCRVFLLRYILPKIVPPGDMSALPFPYQSVQNESLAILRVESTRMNHVPMFISPHGRLSLSTNVLYFAGFARVQQLVWCTGGTTTAHIGDPCYGTVKFFAAQITCKAAPTGPTLNMNVAVPPGSDAQLVVPLLGSAASFAPFAWPATPRVFSA